MADFIFYFLFEILVAGTLIIFLYMAADSGIAKTFGSRDLFPEFHICEERAVDIGSHYM